MRLRYITGDGSEVPGYTSQGREVPWKSRQRNSVGTPIVPESDLPNRMIGSADREGSQGFGTLRSALAVSGKGKREKNKQNQSNKQINGEQQLETRGAPLHLRRSGATVLLTVRCHISGKRRGGKSRKKERKKRAKRDRSGSKNRFRFVYAPGEPFYFEEWTWSGWVDLDDDVKKHDIPDHFR